MAKEFGPSEFRVAVGRYVLGCTPVGLPPHFEQIIAEATLVDRFALEGAHDICCVTVRRSGNGSPFLVVAQGFSPTGAGFEPGLLLAPERDTLFIGAGQRIIAYDLAAPRQLWVDTAPAGFVAWVRQSDVVSRTAELECAAFGSTGEKLWTAFVEPPWG